MVCKIISKNRSDNVMAKTTNGFKEPLSLFLINVHIQQRKLSNIGGENRIHEKICFDDLLLLIIKSVQILSVFCSLNQNTKQSKKNPYLRAG